MTQSYPHDSNATGQRGELTISPVEDVQIDPLAETVWARLSADLRSRLTSEIIKGDVRVIAPDLYSAKADGVLAIFRHAKGHSEGTVLSVLTPSEQAILW